jgi:hypothetical protein
MPTQVEGPRTYSSRFGALDGRRLALAAGFDAFWLADIARASQVRYLPKWAWALICLAQTPGWGIVYLCVGRAGRARSVSPSPARQP